MNEILKGCIVHPLIGNKSYNIKKIPLAMNIN